MCSCDFSLFTLSNWRSAENKKDTFATGIAPFMQQNLHATQISSHQKRDKCPINSSSKNGRVFTAGTLHARHIELKLSRFSLYHGSFCENTEDFHFCGSILVHCYTRSWSHDHICNNADVVFYFRCFSEVGLPELLP